MSPDPVVRAEIVVDLAAVRHNVRTLAAHAGTPVMVVVKADAYGLGAEQVATALAQAGARQFFVAIAQEGAVLRKALGPGPSIGVFAGHMDGDTDLIASLDLTPMLNSAEQLVRHVETLPGHGFGVQLDSGMNRLGMEPAEWAAVRDIALSQTPHLIMSHLACADEPGHQMNAAQLRQFTDMTEGTNIPRSLAATGGILLGPEYHFDLTRPGVGLYGARPFTEAQPVVELDLQVIQVRDVAAGETVGYANSWTASRDSRVATVAAGYADGLLRALGSGLQMFANDRPCPVVGRVSMDLITVDVTDALDLPGALTVLGPQQGVDVLADNAGTIGYEILTSLGARYRREYVQ